MYRSANLSGLLPRIKFVQNGVDEIRRNATIKINQLNNGASFVRLPEDIANESESNQPLKTVLLTDITEAIKKLRAVYVESAQDRATVTTTLWRGMKGLVQGHAGHAPARQARCGGANPRAGPHFRQEETPSSTLSDELFLIISEIPTYSRMGHLKAKRQGASPAARIRSRSLSAAGWGQRPDNAAKRP